MRGSVKVQNVYFTGLNTGKELYIGETGNVNFRQIHWSQRWSDHYVLTLSLWH